MTRPSSLIHPLRSLGDLSCFVCDRCCVILGGLSPRGRDRPSRAREERGPQRTRSTPHGAFTTVGSQLSGFRWGFGSPSLRRCFTAPRLSHAGKRPSETRPDNSGNSPCVASIAKCNTPEGRDLQHRVMCVAGCRDRTPFTGDRRLKRVRGSASQRATDRDDWSACISR